jgi:phosphoribosylformimino-5-aminoimidazole carboxamide ribotide isomerase
MQTPILPVLDLMHRQIVRGIAGQRDEYRPIVSQWVDNAEPLAVARALRAQFGFDEFYLADLDAIRTGQPASDIYEQLKQDGFRLWIDSGLRTARDDAFAALQATNATSIVVGLESITGPNELQQMAEQAGVGRTVFSLDLKAGEPLGPLDDWPGRRAIDIVQHAIEALGVRRVIVLDLANVGVGNGVGTEALCIEVKRAWPQVELTAGGGVRGIDDVKRLVDLGVDRVLVASALHDGRIPRDLR